MLNNYYRYTYLLKYTILIQLKIRIFHRRKMFLEKKKKKLKYLTPISVFQLHLFITKVHKNSVQRRKIFNLYANTNTFLCQ